MEFTVVWLLIWLMVAYIIGFILGAVFLGALMSWSASEGDLVLYVRDGDSDNWIVLVGPDEEEEEEEEEEIIK